MKKFFKKLRKEKYIRIISKIILLLIILILLLGWGILILISTKGLNICYKDYDYLNNIIEKQRIKTCFSLKLNINEKKYNKNDYKLISDINYINGIENGSRYYNNYGIDGNNYGIIGSGWFINGKMFGYYEAYNHYGNGNFIEKRNFKNGELEGKYYKYYENGNIKEEGYYNNGEKIGIRTGYYENGNIQYIENYNNGEYLKYYENGQINEESYYYNGKKSKIQNLYLDDGYKRN